MPKTVILSSARTPIGKLGGGLSSLPATELGATAIGAALERAEVGPADVQHVIMGQVLQAGVGQIPSRQAQIGAGIPKEVSSETINKVCASGMRAAGLIDAAVRAGDLDVAVGGGMESMSQAPYVLKDARFGFRMGDGKALDAMIHDSLTNPFSGRQMFDEATEVGDELEMTRADLDKWALRSHERAIAATDEGRLPEEIVSVTIKGRKGDTTVEIDEAPRRDTSLERLAKLPGLTGKEGSHTAGNSPGSTTAQARSCSPQTFGRRPTTSVCWRRSSPRRRSPTSSPTSPARPPMRPSRRSPRPACRLRTSTCGRSTRRSRRWRSTRCGCCRSTRTR